MRYIVCWISPEGWTHILASCTTAEAAASALRLLSPNPYGALEIVQIYD